MGIKVIRPKGCDHLLKLYETHWLLALVTPTPKMTTDNKNSTPMGQSDVTKSKISGSQKSPQDSHQSDSTKGKTQIFIGSHPLSAFHMVPMGGYGFFRRFKESQKISSSDK